MVEHLSPEPITMMRLALLAGVMDPRFRQTCETLVALAESQAHRISELERLAQIRKDDLELTSADRDGCMSRIAELERGIDEVSRYAQECEDQQKAAYARENELAQQVDDLRAKLDRAVAKKLEIYFNARQLDAFTTDTSADG